MCLVLRTFSDERSDERFAELQASSTVNDNEGTVLCSVCPQLFRFAPKLEYILCVSNNKIKTPTYYSMYLRIAK